MIENKSYYAIIPANVRYDKDLPANAKLLYGEITALCNEKGYCWAENRYFAELYKVSKTSISKWISALADKGYIRLRMVYKEGTKEIQHRYITIVNEPIEEKLNTYITNVNEPIEEKLKDNNTNNNTSNNTDNISPISPKRDTTDYNAVIEAYNDTCYSLPSVKTLSDSRKRAIRKLYKNYSMEQINEVFLKAQCSDFLSGKNGKWNATFDWLIKDSNFIKVLEGNYDNKVATASRIDWMDDAL